MKKLFQYINDVNIMKWMLKKLIKFLPLSLLCFSGATFVSSCSTHFSMNITYGTYINNIGNPYEGIMLDVLQEVKDKINIFKESFILTVIPTNEACSCWKDFRGNVLNKLIKDKNIVNYAIKANAISTLRPEDRGGFEYSDAAPILYFINGENNTRMKFDYYGGSKSIFVDFESFVSNMEKYCAYPKTFLINEEYLEENINSQERQIVYYYRYSCGDCQDVMPKVIAPYINQNYNAIHDKIWAIDLDPLRATDPEGYQQFKDEWHLSSAKDEIYGFGEGAVPTLQYYENGTLKDMNVYFNDTVSHFEQENIFYISNTYYTPGRIPNLHYLPSGTEHLFNKVLSEKEVSDWGEGEYGWKPDYARKYHANFTNLFLQAYLK